MRKFLIDLSHNPVKKILNNVEINYIIVFVIHINSSMRVDDTKPNLGIYRTLVFPLIKS